MVLATLRRGCLIALVCMVGVVVLPRVSAAAGTACSAVDQSVVARVMGPTSLPVDVTRDGDPGCRLEIGDLTLEVIPNVRRAGFDRLRAAYPSRSREEIHDYVDGAFFGWGTDGSLALIAKRGDQVIALRVAGRTTTFDSVDPASNAAGGEVSGSTIGSDLWVLATDVFQRTADVESPTSNDLSGLWRATGITPCPPASTVGVRVSRFVTTGGSLRATKVAGDSCLDTGQVDFSGTIDGTRGAGLAFGSRAAATAGTPYELTVVSPVLLRLTGQAGTLRYTLEYQRLSWPGLTSSARTSSLLGIPSPTEALTPKNVALTGLLSIVLFALVVFPSTLFDSTLQANLAHYRASIAKLRSKMFPRGTRPRPPGSISLRDRPAGIVLYLLGAGALFSLMQPNWGFNAATFITFFGFVMSLVVTSGISVLATRTYLSFRYKQGAGKAAFEASTLGLAAFCVAASRFVGFVPGYLYGVVVGWEPEHRRDDFDRGRIIGFAAVLTAVIAIATWLMIPALRHFGGSNPSSLKMIPLATVSGVFVGAVNSLTIGMIPLEFLPGKILRRHNRVTWIVTWALGGFLFVLVLLRPGLVSGETRSIVGTCAIAALFGAASLIFWAYHRRRTQRRPVSPGAQSSA